MKKKIMFKQFLLSSCRPGQALPEILRFALDDITKRNHKSEIINHKSEITFCSSSSDSSPQSV